jgi:hypothetical protein
MELVRGQMENRAKWPHPLLCKPRQCWFYRAPPRREPVCAILRPCTPYIVVLCGFPGMLFETGRAASRNRSPAAIRGRPVFCANEF